MFKRVLFFILFENQSIQNVPFDDIIKISLILSEFLGMISTIHNSLLKKSYCLQQVTIFYNLDSCLI